jgi:hypothetical protein
MAHDIEVVSISANQGVDVPLWVDGESVGGSGRNTSLLRDRVTFVRAIHQVPDDWEAREIRALLHLVAPDQDEVVGDVTAMIEPGEPNLASVDGGFAWVLPAELAVVDTQFYVELFEVEESHLGQEDPDPLPRYPETGLDLVGFEDLSRTLNIVVIPITDNDGDCTQTPDITDEHVEELRQFSLAINPVQSVNVEVRDPVAAANPIGTNLSEPLTIASSIRMMDDAPDNTAYLAVTDACGGAQSGTTCLFNFGTGASAAIYGTSVGGFADIQKYCLRGSMNLPQVECTNSPNPGELDPDYPYEDGKIGRWGFSVVTHELKRPDLYFSTQSTCSPAWVSDHEWNKLLSKLAE